ncbi:MAG: pantoate--beta-alanine ligase [Pseudomonadota bacterium]
MAAVERIAQVREYVSAWRSEGLRVAFVPTMGNLHAGHLSLMAHAREAADRVVASIFVNPLQFGVGEDYQSYPRTMEADKVKLDGAGVHLLFSPTVAEMYPAGQKLTTQVAVPELGDDLCGAARPGHFSGMATIVTKLLNVVQPDVALFGQKDFQQLVIIRRLVEDLCLPVEVTGVPTTREADGLAMSSRNQYLTNDERTRAPALYSALEKIADALADGAADIKALCSEGERALQAAGFLPEYIQVRRARDLAVPDNSDRNLVVLAAARLGKARLIDNIAISR